MRHNDVPVAALVKGFFSIFFCCRTCSEWPMYLQKEVNSFIHILRVHLRSGLSHVVEEIRLDALKIVDTLISAHPFVAPSLLQEVLPLPHAPLHQSMARCSRIIYICSAVMTPANPTPQPPNPPRSNSTSNLQNLRWCRGCDFALSRPSSVEKFSRAFSPSSGFHRLPPSPVPISCRL